MGEGLHSSAAPSHSDKPCPLLSRPMKSLHNFKCCMLTGSISRQITGCLNCDSPGILNEFLFFAESSIPLRLEHWQVMKKKKKKKRFSRAPRNGQPCLHSYTQPVQPVSCCWSLCSPICVHCLAPVDLHENSNHEIITNDVTPLKANKSLFRLLTAILSFVIIISEWPPLDPRDRNICCSNGSRERRKLLSKSL